MNVALQVGQSVIEMGGQLEECYSLLSFTSTVNLMFGCYPCCGAHENALIPLVHVARPHKCL